MKFISKVILDDANQPKEMFDTIYSVLNPSRNVMRDVTPQETCEELLLFFTQNLEKIRNAIVPSHSLSSSNPVLPKLFTNFEPVSSAQLANIVSKMNGGSCRLYILLIILKMFYRVLA